MIVNFVLVAVVCKLLTVTLMECDNMFHYYAWPQRQETLL